MDMDIEIDSYEELMAKISFFPKPSNKELYLLLLFCAHKRKYTESTVPNLCKQLSYS